MEEAVSIRKQVRDYNPLDSKKAERIHPKSLQDLSLAPVAVEIDRNLQRLRGKPFSDIELELSLELDAPVEWDDPAQRREHVLAFAIRNVTLHDWDTTLTDDWSAIRLSGGSVTLDVALSRTVEDFLARE
jgi:hypothetical protein